MRFPFQLCKPLLPQHNLAANMDASTNILQSYFWYPETAHRSLEEIDIIFAKGFYEKKSYVTAAKELPPLSVDDMERLASEYGLSEFSSPKKGSDVEVGDAQHLEKGSSDN